MSKTKSKQLPSGTFVYPHLEEPNKKFEPTYGQYMTKVRFDNQKGLTLFNEIQQMIDDLFERTKEELIEKKKHDKAKTLQKHNPVKVVLDDDGNETGEYEVMVKRPAGGLTKDGKQWSRKVPIFDSKGNAIIGKIGIGSGTKGIPLVDIREYYSPAQNTCGVSMRLDQVAILNLVKYSGGMKMDISAEADEDAFQFDADDVEETSSITTDEGSDDDLTPSFA